MPREFWSVGMDGCRQRRLSWNNLRVSSQFQLFKSISNNLLSIWYELKAGYGPFRTLGYGQSDLDYPVNLISLESEFDCPSNWLSSWLCQYKFSMPLWHCHILNYIIYMWYITLSWQWKLKPIIRVYEPSISFSLTELSFECDG